MGQEQASLLSNLDNAPNAVQKANLNASCAAGMSRSALHNHIRSK
jgi:hypothetical protein